jgi:raffinose/stachyose/melibiose transport system substrate-binding protein
MIINGSWVFTKAVPSLGDDLGYVKFPRTGAVTEPFQMNTGERSDTPYGLFVNAQSKQLSIAKEFAIRYSLKVNDELVKLGQPSYAVTQTKAEGRVNEAYARYLADFHQFRFIQTYWFATLPAAVGESYRDLNQRLYTGTLSAADFVRQMEQIMRKS